MKINFKGSSLGEVNVGDIIRFITDYEKPQYRLVVEGLVGESPYNLVNLNCDSLWEKEFNSLKDIYDQYHNRTGFTIIPKDKITLLIKE